MHFTVMKSSLLILVLLLFTGSYGILFTQKDVQNLLKSGALDVNVWRCFLRNQNKCPSPFLQYRLYTPNSSRVGSLLNIMSPLTLFKSGFQKHRETTVLIHGFNGTAHDKHLQYLKDAYIHRDYNVITVDWSPLTRYPCYIHALINTKLVAQCTAQIYSFITHYGALPKKITCVGHSLGAHICGMITNYLTSKQYRIIGLDPARPLIERKKNSRFRLTVDDASNIQVIHTNAGFLGQEENTGHLNYCVNGGRVQPYCKGNIIRRSRCSHYLSICYLANALFKHKSFPGVTCKAGCVKGNSTSQLHQHNEFYMGNDAPDTLKGCYCIYVPYAKHCPFVDT